MAKDDGYNISAYIATHSHYDHIGHGSRNSMARRFKQWDGVDPLPAHPGADDNASGVTAVLLAAAMLERDLASEPNRRTVVVLFTTGEEDGYIGLRFLASQQDELAFDFKRTYAAMNVDMVGRLRDDRLGVYYTDEWKGWSPVLVQANEGVGLTLVTDEQVPGYGDELILRRLDLPAVLLHTGLHDEYHTPDDKPATLNYAGAMRVTRFVAAAGRVLATE